MIMLPNASGGMSALGLPSIGGIKAGTNFEL
jgi:hypothetical protein